MALRRLVKNLQNNQLPKNGQALIRRRIWQVVAAFSLLAAPFSVLAWQTGGTAASNNGTVTEPDSSNNQPVKNANVDKSTGSSNQHISIDTQHTSNGTSNTQSSSHVSVTSNSSTDSDSSTSVWVNGQKVSVPASGEVHKTVTSDGAQTQVDISVSGNQASDGSSNSNAQANADQFSNDWDSGM